TDERALFSRRFMALALCHDCPRAHASADLIMSNPKRKLPLVAPENELSGKFPRGFERAVRACKVGDETHRAVIWSCSALSGESARRCLPPSIATSSHAALQA